MNNRPLSAEQVSEMAALLLKEISDSVLCLQRDGQLLYANPAACEYLGLGVDDFYSYSVLKFSPRASLTTWQQHCDQCSNDGYARLNTWYQTSTGDSIPVEYVSYPFNNEYYCSVLRESVSTAEYRKVLNHSLDRFRIAGFQWVVTSNHLISGSHLCELFGTDKTQTLTPEGISEYLSQSSQFNWKIALRQLLQHATPIDLKLRGQNAKGEPIVLHAVLNATQDEEGKVDNVIGLYRNIYEEYEQEQSLHLSQALIQYTRQPTCYVQSDGKVYYTNSAFRAHFGWTEQQLDQLSVFALEPILQARSWTERWIELWQHGTTRIHSMLRSATGEDFAVAIDVVRVTNQERQLLAYQIADVKRAWSNTKTRDFPSLEEVQCQHILLALQLTDGRVSGRKGAAELLDINSKTLFARMKKLGITRHDRPGQSR